MRLELTSLTYGQRNYFMPEPLICQPNNYARADTVLPVPRVFVSECSQKTRRAGLMRMEANRGDEGSSYAEPKDRAESRCGQRTMFTPATTYGSGLQARRR